MTSKYRPLYQFLARFDGNKWPATFAEVEGVLGFRLPASARKHRAWWANDTKGHSYARAWLDAGWETGDVSLDKESLIFARAGGPARNLCMRSRPTPSSREKRCDVRGPSEDVPSVMRLLDYVFVHADIIRPERGPEGRPSEFMPQSKYAQAETTLLNRHGMGPFCRFNVEGLPTTSGVYALTIGGVLAYVGKAADLARRWGPMGYGNISPRACYVGGQSTNCKVNNYILKATHRGCRIDLWIHETPEPEPIESRLIREMDPSWNGQRPSDGIE